MIKTFLKHYLQLVSNVLKKSAANPGGMGGYIPPHYLASIPPIILPSIPPNNVMLCHKFYK